MSRITVRGSVVSMNESFSRFAIGLMLSILLVYLILMAQFASFMDPFIILMAIPPGLAGVFLILLITGSTINIMSLMGVIMMAGIVVSNSILIVEFAGHLHEEGMPLAKAVVESCRIRLRPILMTSLGDASWHDPHGSGSRGRQRTICTSGPSDHRRSGRFSCVDCLSGAGRVPDHSRSQGEENSSRGRGINRYETRIENADHFHGNVNSDHRSFC